MNLAGVQFILLLLLKYNYVFLTLLKTVIVLKGQGNTI